MANHEEGPQAPPIAQGAHDPLAPQNPSPHPNPQIPPVPNVPHVPQAWQVLQQPILHVQPLHWSYFKSNCLRNQKKMPKHTYLGQEWISGQCQSTKILLDTKREARLWYKSLRLINVDWLGLQNTFRPLLVQHLPLRHMAKTAAIKVNINIENKS